MKKCKICNIEYSDAVQFCSQCGSKLEFIGDELKNENDNFIYGNKQEANTDFNHNTGNSKTNVLKSHYKLLIALALILIVVIYFVYPRTLLINNGDDIVAYVDETSETVSLYGNGLSESDYDSAEWYFYDDTVNICISNNKIKPAYDENALVDHDEDSTTEYNSDDGEFSYRTTVSATVKKGLKKWTGDATVIVKLKEKTFKNGKMIKSPAASTGSTITVTAGDYNAYLYLESSSSSENDLAFMVKKNKTVTIDVPCNEYTMYVAQGDVWYGSKYLFGPGTSMTKDNETMDFATYSWTYELNVSNGNVDSDEISSADFPR